MEMLVAGCSMLVEDPVFSGDKEKNLPYSIQYPEINIQYHVLSNQIMAFYQNLTSRLAGLRSCAMETSIQHNGVKLFSIERNRPKIHW